MSFLRLVVNASLVSLWSWGLRGRDSLNHARETHWLCGLCPLLQPMKLELYRPRRQDCDSRRLRNAQLPRLPALAAPTVRLKRSFLRTDISKYSSRLVLFGVLTRSKNLWDLWRRDAAHIDIWIDFTDWYWPCRWKLQQTVPGGFPAKDAIFIFIHPNGRNNTAVQ